MNRHFQAKLQSIDQDNLRFLEPMTEHTSFGIGGIADYLARVESKAALINLIALAKDFRQPIFLLGQGTNILVSDRGIRGLVIQLAGEFSNAEVMEEEIIAGAACPISRLLKLSIQHHLTGLEFAVGIPGSVGGAVYLNAGSFDEAFGSFVKEVHIVYPDGSCSVRTGNELRFFYRQSSFEKEIITKVVFHLHKVAKESIISKIKEGYKYRISHQPIREKSAGCIFKNPTGDFAGRLIDQAGLKGLSVGDAQVSPIHANFIINREKATCRDVLLLRDLVQKRVNEVCGVLLELEVLVVGEALYEK